MKFGLVFLVVEGVGKCVRFSEERFVRYAGTLLVLGFGKKLCRR